MLPKRVRQFVMNLTDRINEDDYEYVKSKLDEREYEIFKLTNGEILDIGTILPVCDELVKNREMLVKVGLLHDVGKSRQRINIIDKSIIVILKKLTHGKLRNINLNIEIEV